MQHSQANRAYRAASAHRSPREQEADVFRRVTGALRAGQNGTPLDQTKALPAGLRASVVSVGQALQREMRKPLPDFAFLIAVNEDVTAGLCGPS